MSDIPSYKNSTLAKMAWWAFISFIVHHAVLIPLWLKAGISPQLIDQMISEPLKWITVTFGVSYLTARKAGGQ